jgi:hypothetical protein
MMARPKKMAYEEEAMWATKAATTRATTTGQAAAHIANV